MEQVINDMGALARRFEKELIAHGRQLDQVFIKYANRLKELIFSNVPTDAPEYTDVVEMLEAVQHSIVTDYLAVRGWELDPDDSPYYRWVKRSNSGRTAPEGG